MSATAPQLPPTPPPLMPASATAPKDTDPGQSGVGRKRRASRRGGAALPHAPVGGRRTRKSKGRKQTRRR